MTNETAARALGIAGIGIGLTELFGSKWLNSTMGTNAINLTRAMGVREIAAGVGVLAPKTVLPGILSRVAGDALDITLLAFALKAARKNKKGIVMGVLAGVAAVTLADVVVSAIQLRKERAAAAMER